MNGPRATRWAGPRLALAASVLTLACPAYAQDQEAPADPFAQNGSLDEGRYVFGEGRTAEVGGTELGQRREADDVARINPMGRVDSRIPNRVENRVRGRIDRNYNPRATTTSSIEVAGELTRRSGRPARPAPRR